MTPQQTSDLVRSGDALLVDVRESHEWRSGHISGAVHAPLSNFKLAAQDLPRDRKIVLYCLSGARSASALRYCKEIGLEGAVNMAGGISAWQRQGLPVVR